jgi:poly(A) polymerase
METQVPSGGGEGSRADAGLASCRTVVRPRSEHSISRKDLDPDALDVLYRLSRQGYTAYLVGGGVRDLLLGQRPKDFDVGTDAHPREIKRIFRNCFLVGRRFRLAHIRFGDKVIETSTFRRPPPPDEETEHVAGDSLLQHRDNTFGSPEEDAQRRDFTINALFYDIRTFSVIDHVGGLADLDLRIIRSIGDPNVRFREDPVRMIRAVRFASRLGFTIESHTYEAIRRHHREITRAAAPRLFEEVQRLFPFRKAEPAFRLLRETGLLHCLLPEVDAYVSASGDMESPFWRYLAALDSRATTTPDPSDSLRLATLLYPVFRHRLSQGPPQGHEAAVHHEAAFLLLHPLAPRYQMSKQILYRTLRVLCLQRRIEGQPPNAPIRRLMAQDGFTDAVSLHGIHLAAINEGLTGYLHWQRQYEQFLAEGGTPAGPGAGHGEGHAEPVRRRRRRRRRRRVGPEN